MLCVRSRLRPPDMCCVSRTTVYKWVREGRINTRRGAIAAILLLQAVVLGVGWFVMFRQVRHATTDAVQDLVLRETSRVAEWLGSQLPEDTSAPIAYGSADWQRVQRRIETLRLPGEGYVELLDEHGAVLCHPRLRRSPAMRGFAAGNMSIATAPKDGNVMIGDASRESTVTGRLQHPESGTHYVATRYIPELRARIVVHQPEAGLITLSSRATFMVGLVAVVAALAVIALTALSTWWVMRRYDHALELANKGLGDEVERRTQQNLRARDALIMGLAKLADCRDNETGLHLERISCYSCKLAAELAPACPEIDEAWIDRLRLASSLHDIGKVGVPDELLLKPGRFTPEEHARMQVHTTLGADTLTAIRNELGEDDLLDMSIQIALEHHERWDGNGYPFRASGKQISLPARIVALADVYDALTSRRVYKRAMSHTDAVGVIIEGRGSHFDPMIVDTFLEIADDFDKVRKEMHEAWPLFPALAA